MSLMHEFKAFVAKGNVVDLAVAVVVGGAFGKIVDAFVKGIVMPLVELALPKDIAWEQWTLGPFKVGTLLDATINFLVIALVVFLVFVKGLAVLTKKREADAPAPEPTKTCPRCLETVPAAATRCKHCTSEL